MSHTWNKPSKNNSMDDVDQVYRLTLQILDSTEKKTITTTEHIYREQK